MNKHIVPKMDLVVYGIEIHRIPLLKSPQRLGKTSIPGLTSANYEASNIYETTRQLEGKFKPQAVLEKPGSGQPFAWGRDRPSDSQAK
jgi:hypothetical protein